MRQAGRYHSHYRNLRARSIRSSTCASRPSSRPRLRWVRCDAFDFDAAILFSDLLFPLEAMGMPLVLRAGTHLRLAACASSRISSVSTATSAASSSSTSRRRRCAASASSCPQSKGLLGFVGGPLTLFFYAAAGSHQADARRRAFGPARWALRGLLRQADPAPRAEHGAAMARGRRLRRGLRHLRG